MINVPFVLRHFPFALPSSASTATQLDSSNSTLQMMATIQVAVTPASFTVKALVALQVRVGRRFSSLPTRLHRKSSYTTGTTSCGWLRTSVQQSLQSPFPVITITDKRYLLQDPSVISA